MTERTTNTERAIPGNGGSTEDGPEPDLPTDPTEQTADTEEEEEPETFPREYVQQLRDENAKHRTRAQRADDLAKRLHTSLVAATGRLADPSDLAFDDAHLEDPATLEAAIDQLSRTSRTLPPVARSGTSDRERPRRPARSPSRASSDRPRHEHRATRSVGSSERAPTDPRSHGTYEPAPPKDDGESVYEKKGRGIICL